MKPTPILSRIRRLACVLGAAIGLSLVPPIHAQLVWTGPTITFTKADGDDWTLAAHQDRITAGVWLTRGAVAGLFNIAIEPAYDGNTRLSPLGTEWAFTGLNGNPSSGVTAANYASLIFASWAASVDDSPPSMVGQAGVLHLIGEDVYLDITFSSWTVRGGGFSYTRASVPEPATARLLGGLLAAGAICWRRRLLAR